MNTEQRLEENEVKEPIFDPKQVADLLIDEVKKALTKMKAVRGTLPLLKDKDKGLLHNLERANLDVLIALTDMKLTLEHLQQKEVKNEEADITKN